jgi:SAM-dependent methyltransferase
LASHSGFSSVNGTAGATKPPDRSVNAIFCAQAFHWFNEEPTRVEWQRILRPGGRAALVWNNRDPSDGFTADYLELLLAGGAAARKTLAASLGTQTDNVFFPQASAETVAFPQTQILDFTGLLGPPYRRRLCRSRPMTGIQNGRSVCRKSSTVIRSTVP